MSRPLDDFVSPKEKHLYTLYSPSLNISRSGRTDNFERRLQEHKNTINQDVYFTMQASHYGHTEKYIHDVYRHRRTTPRDEKIPGYIDPQAVADMLPDLHKRFMGKEKELVASRKRSREEADLDLYNAEINAKIEVVTVESTARAVESTARGAEAAAKAERLQLENELYRIKLDLLRTNKITLQDFGSV